MNETVPPPADVEVDGGETPAPEHRRQGALAAAAVGLLLLLGLAVVWFTILRSVNPQPAGREVTVTIPLRSDTRAIGQILAEKGIVANPSMFLIQARMTHSDGRLKAGTYVFTTGMDYPEVLDRLQSGPSVDGFLLTVPEGFTIDQIAQRLEIGAGIPASDFKTLAKTQGATFDRAFLKSDHTKSLEGYLFPKTYRVKKGSSARAVIDMMLDQFEKETEGLDLSYVRQRGLTLHELVTIGSMVERETRVPNERPLVASVIYNRLDRNMRLEIDATVQYVLGNKPRLLYRDLQVPSPYNTYLHKGLPPGPIASPGLASLRAAAAPRKTGYIYYVLTGKDGSHTFASNQKDFLAAKQRAKEGLR